MSLLGFDTSTPATAVGVLPDDGALLEARDDPAEGARPGHATRLLPLAHELLGRAQTRWHDLERIVVGVGPGTFTGLRIGVATAHGLAQSLSIPLVGVSSLGALAHAAAPHVECEEEAVLAVLDARRGEVFLAAYLHGRCLLEPLALAPAVLAESLERVARDTGISCWLAVGDGATRYRDVLALSGVRVPAEDSPLHRVSARAICELGVRARLSEHPLTPDYVRLPDVEIALQGTPPAPESAADVLQGTAAEQQSATDVLRGAA